MKKRKAASIRLMTRPLSALSLFGMPHAPLEAFVDAIACCVSILHHPTVKA
ncbi:hypothetical protein HMPREF9418_0969 [Neisseria macacae ATCC 33926]|uniref:Uncharacterized protein n=1 Tax=Neisseria macacae ATCC 33926 TaxID=997348 RepID=A0AA36XL06_9NEIS|nr:hypothetical protein HMPREF9418_0969 [Neisseria macacae ATCC 33926]